MKCMLSTVSQANNGLHVIIVLSFRQEKQNRTDSFSLLHTVITGREFSAPPAALWPSVYGRVNPLSGMWNVGIVTLIVAALVCAWKKAKWEPVSKSDVQLKPQGRVHSCRFLLAQLCMQIAQPWSENLLMSFSFQTHLQARTKADKVSDIETRLYVSCFFIFCYVFFLH